MRARIGKHVILDTTRAQLLFEDERHPWRAVPKDAVLAPLAGPAVADRLDGCWWAVELDGTRHDRAVRTWDSPPADLSPARPGCGLRSPRLAERANFRRVLPLCSAEPERRTEARTDGKCPADLPLRAPLQPARPPGSALPLSRASVTGNRPVWASAPPTYPPCECRLPAGLTECDGIGMRLRARSACPTVKV